MKHEPSTTWKRRTARTATALLAVGLFVIGAPQASHAQIETNPITRDQRLPPDVLRDVDRDAVRRDVTGLRIVDSSAARILSAENVRLQGVGDAIHYHVRYEISIENPGTETRFFRIITDVNGETRNRSRRFGIRAGQRVRETQEFRFHLPREGLALTGFLDRNARPVDVTLLDRDGTKHDHVALALESTGRTAAADRPRRDLRVYRLRAELQAPGHRDNRTKAWSIRATVSVANTGAVYWNDAASVTVSYARGRSGRTMPIAGLAGTTKPVPPGIRSGDSLSLELRTQRRLAEGWYTATARLTSRDDQDASNNISVYEFYVRDDRR